MFTALNTVRQGLGHGRLLLNYESHKDVVTGASRTSDIPTQFTLPDISSFESCIVNRRRRDSECGGYYHGDDDSSRPEDQPRHEGLNYPYGISDDSATGAQVAYRPPSPIPAPMIVHRTHEEIRSISTWISKWICYTMDSHTSLQPVIQRNTFATLTERIRRVLSDTYLPSHVVITALAYINHLIPHTAFDHIPNPSGETLLRLMYFLFLLGIEFAYEMSGFGQGQILSLSRYWYPLEPPAIQGLYIFYRDRLGSRPIEVDWSAWLEELRSHTSHVLMDGDDSENLELLFGRAAEEFERIVGLGEENNSHQDQDTQAQASRPKESFLRPAVFAKSASNFRSGSAQTLVPIAQDDIIDLILKNSMSTSATQPNAVSPMQDGQEIGTSPRYPDNITSFQSSLQMLLSEGVKEGAGVSLYIKPRDGSNVITGKQCEEEDAAAEEEAESLCRRLNTQPESSPMSPLEISVQGFSPRPEAGLPYASSTSALIHDFPISPNIRTPPVESGLPQTRFVSPTLLHPLAQRPYTFIYAEGSSISTLFDPTPGAWRPSRLNAPADLDLGSYERLDSEGDEVDSNPRTLGDHSQHDSSNMLGLQFA
ncbi:hypothetical protein WG66_006676 [Moniliophthora roreri]|nr:hypothetical protein WG66_006676 [Moniliophthora roreri]